MLDLSYTKVRTYLNCPWLYKLFFIDNKKTPPSPHSSLGHSVHKAFAKFHECGGKSIEEIEDALNDCWESIGYKNAAQELDFFDKAKQILTTYIDNIACTWDSEILGIEKSFKFEIPQLNIKIQGIIDRVDRLSDGSIAIIDYKTHAQIWNETRLKEDMQITIYAQAAINAMGMKNPKLFFFFVSHGIVREVIRSEADWEQLKNTLSDIAVKLQGGQFPCRTEYCQWCDMKNSCGYSIVKK
ncbi:RecB family exonuclease [Elusimicrobiota bacterium]